VLFDTVNTGVKIKQDLIQFYEQKM